MTHQPVPATPNPTFTRRAYFWEAQPTRATRYRRSATRISLWIISSATTREVRARHFYEQTKPTTSGRVFANETQATEERVLCGLRWVLDHAYKIDVALVAFNRVDDSVADDSTCEVDVLRSIVCALSEAGVTVVVAAGNQKADASGFVPAKLVEVITVGAFVDFDGLPGGFGSPTCGPGVDDGLADFSNTGPNIDILAPGVCIETVGLNGDESTVVPSGTSLAAAHVAGVAAIYKACHVDAAPDEVRTALLAAAETVSIEDVDFSLVSAWEFDRNSCRDVNHDA